MRGIVLLAGLVCGSFPALAQSIGAPLPQATTVQSLLGQGYGVVGTVPSSAGPGVFLFKAPNLWVCFVAETPGSATVATKYCKRVE